MGQNKIQPTVMWYIWSDGEHEYEVALTKDGAGRWSAAATVKTEAHGSRMDALKALIGPTEKLRINLEHVEIDDE